MARLNIESLEAAGASAGADSAGVLLQLGLMYCSGRDVPADFVEAHKWFNIAAIRGSDEAKTHRIEVAQQMSSDEVAEALRQARAWMQMH